jgi:uncharacterized pyridoxamine 5'-phosphate oxidase family protein
MDKEYVFSFLNNNPIFHLANIQNGKPHVRGLLLYRADENGIIFHTSKSKELFYQLSNDPHVELCFNNYKENIQIRIEGAVEFIEDLNLKNEIIEGREKLKPWIFQKGIDMLSVVCLSNGLANVWTPELTFMPKRYIRL